MKWIRVIVMLCLTLEGFAGDGTVRINGKASSFPGKKISANIYQDFFSRYTTKLVETTISESGAFSLNFPLASTSEIVLKVDGVNSFLYADPGSQYTITIADLQEGQNKSYHNNRVECLFDTLPKLDINNLILDFDERLDAFMAYNLRKLGKKEFKMEVDTFKRYLKKVYDGVYNPYFKDYVIYSIASIEQIGGVNVDMVKLKALLYRDYLSSGKILYHHEKFMIFFDQYFTDVFKLADEQEEKELYRAINSKRSVALLDDLLRKDRLLKDEKTRQLVMIKSLAEEYHSGLYDQDNIIYMLDSIEKTTVFPEHVTIARNLKDKLTRLNAGYPAPDFVLLDSKSKPYSLSDFKGKYIYLHFWATWNTSAISEMKIMTELYKNYGQDIVFISVNMDDKESDWTAFLKANPEMKWYHLYYGNQPEIIDLYRISSLSIFYLIGPDGRMVQSPAYRPTPNGTGKTIEETFYDIHRRLHPSRRRVPGQK